MHVQTRVTVSGNPYYYTISKVQFCSNGCMAAIGAPRTCQDYLGSDDLQVRSLRHRSGHVASTRRRSRGSTSQPAGFLVNGGGRRQIPAAAAVRCAGDGQLRQVVRVLPDPHPGDEDRGGHRVFGAERGQRARRLPHALGKRHRRHVPERGRRSTATQKTDVVHQLLRGRPAWNFKRRCPMPCFASANISRTPATSRPAGRDRSARCQPRASASRITTCCRPTATGTCQLDAAGSVGDQDRTVPGNLPGPIAGFTPGSPFPRPYFEGPTPTSNSLADLAMHYWITDLRPDLADNVPGHDRAVAARDALRRFRSAPQGSIAYPTGLDAITAGTSGSGRTADRDRPVAGGPTRSTTSGTPRSTAAASISTPRIRRSWPRASSVRWPTSSAPPAPAPASAIAGAQITATRNFGYQTSYESSWCGRRQEVRARPQDRRAAGRQRRQSAQPAGVVGRSRSSTRRCSARVGIRTGGS